MIKVWHSPSWGMGDAYASAAIAQKRLNIPDRGIVPVSGH